jgi:hypothetical protein
MRNLSHSAQRLALTAPRCQLRGGDRPAHLVDPTPQQSEFSHKVGEVAVDIAQRFVRIFHAPAAPSWHQLSLLGRNIAGSCG